MAINRKPARKPARNKPTKRPSKKAIKKAAPKKKAIKKQAPKKKAITKQAPKKKVASKRRAQRLAIQPTPEVPQRMDYPFPVFGHRATDLDAKLKNAETYVLFSRAPTDAERLQIKASCPVPLARMWTWGERFAYFGSGGDTFDWEVLEVYGGPKANELMAADAYEEAGALMPQAFTAFDAAYDAWLATTHAVVPILAAGAPTRAETDDWGTWSLTRLDDVLAALEAASAVDIAAKQFGWIRQLLLAQREEVAG